jgi:hypothetical protein
VNDIKMDPSVIGTAAVIVILAWIVWTFLAITIGWFFGWGWCFAVLTVAAFHGLRIFTKAAKQAVRK